MRTFSLRRLFRRLRPTPPLAACAERGPAHYEALYLTSGRPREHYARSHYYPLWAVIADRLRTAGARRVLEVGCGSGQLDLLLLEQGVTDFAGFDFAPAAVAMAQAACPSGRFYVGDA